MSTGDITPEGWGGTRLPIKDDIDGGTTFLTEGWGGD